MEQAPLIDDVYKGEKEPEGKGNDVDVVDGSPAGVGGDVVGQPVSRTPWSTGLCSCLGSADSSDVFCGVDTEVCVLGSVAPCVLHASNVERLEPYQRSFMNHCLPYSLLFCLGNFLFNTNCFAPMFSFTTRTAIRRRFNLQGNCESLGLECCMGETEESKEQCESMCDFMVHFCCHPCALCQEGREVRRHIPHHPFNSNPHYAMLPPQHQFMN